MMRAPRKQRGVALVLVMWVGVILTVVAGAYILERRTETLVVMNSASMARAEAVADAGVARAVFEVYRRDMVPDGWRPDGTPHDFEFEGVPVRVEVRDESAKIDVNSAPDALLRGLLLSVGLADAEAAQLLDAILDWRDPDPLKRPNGAEEADYRGAGLAYRPGNAPFQAVEELQLVLGMRPELFRRIAPLVTVYSRQPGINPQVATREVLLAVPGLGSDIVDDYIARREAARAAGEPLPTLPQAGAFAAASMAMVVNIRSMAKVEDGALFVRDAVALLRPVPRRPVTYLSWRESTAPQPQPASAVEGQVR